MNVTKALENIRKIKEKAEKDIKRITEELSIKDKRSLDIPKEEESND